MSETFFSAPPAQPLDWLQDWISDARRLQLNEPMAMNLASVDRDGKPSSRIVLYKGMDAKRICFYTNYNSRKSEQLLANQAAALCFWWDPLMRQLRIEGRCEKLSDEQSDDYFASRARGSQLGAWASAQSQPVASRTLMDEAYQAAEQRFQDQPVSRPPHWGGFALSIERIEFWQGRDNRFHDRMLYQRQSAEQWQISRLQP